MIIIIIIIIIISCGLTEGNARDHSTWSIRNLSEENRCKLDDAWMNEWMNKKNFHWYSKNSSSSSKNNKTTTTTTTTKISGFVTCFQRAGAKKSLKLSKDERTDVFQTVTATRHMNKHNSLWENAFTLLALFISSLNEFCVTACDIWPYVGLKSYLYYQLSVQTR